MSYARFGVGGSEVYVFDTFATDEGAEWECCMCCLKQNDAPVDAWSFRCATRAEMIAHLYEHRAAGHCVPDETFAELEAEEAAGLANGRYLF